MAPTTRIQTSMMCCHPKVVWNRACVVVAALLMSVSLASSAAAQIMVTAAWDPNADGRTAGYLVSIGTSPGTTASTIDAGPATSAVLPLPPGGVYYISVRGYNAQRLTGPPSAEEVVDLASSPGAPQGLRASVAGSVASLAWAPPDEGFAMRYLLSVGTAPGAENLLSEYPVGNVTSVSGSLPAGIYYARVQAANIVGVGPTTAEVMFRVGASIATPGTPANLAAAWSNGTVTLSWAPSSGATSYALEVGSASGASDIGVFNIGNVTSYSAVVPTGTYYVRVRGVNAGGSSAPSNQLVLQSAPVAVPGAPLNLTSSGSGATVTLRWAAPSSGGTPTGYVVEVGSASGQTDLGVFSVGAVTTITSTAPPGTYYVRVRAANGSGVGAASNTVVVRR
ncbi:MAG: fibronectin type III domain-containing protein [Acidobacteria bacterium]|nr:fibronectin type III domain-containing protein [Acidobacteriota bacterium]